MEIKRMCVVCVSDILKKNARSKRPGEAFVYVTDKIHDTRMSCAVIVEFD
jgi:hypothetical protein